MKKIYEAAVILSAVDRMSETVRKAFSFVENKMAATQKAANAFASKSAAVARQSAMIGAVAAAPLIYAGDKAIEFEDKMADVGKVLNMRTGSSELAQVGKDVRQMSVYLAQGQEQVAGLYASLAQGGVAADQLNTVSKIAGQMGVAFDMASELAGDKFIKIQNALGATTTQTKALADTMNYLSDKEAAKASQLVDFFSAGGASATNMLKIAPQVSAAFGTMFISAGKSGEEAATIYERFTKGVMKGGNEASKIFQSKGGGLEGMKAVIEHGRKLKGQEQFKFFKAFGEYGPEVAQMANNYGKFQSVLAEAMDTQAQVGSMEREFANRQSTTKTKLAQAKIAFDDLAITVGTKLLPSLTPLIDKASAVISKIAAWMDANPKLTKQIAEGVAIFAALSFTISGVAGIISGISTAVSVGATVFGHLAKAIRLIGTVVSFVGRLMLANPILLVIALIAGAAYLIYKNWDSIKAFFVRLWGSIKEIFWATWEWVKNLFLKYRPLGILISHWEEVKTFFAGLGTTLFNAGANVIRSIWEGMKSLAMKPVEVIKDIATKVREYLPFSPAKVGPFKDLHRVKIVETIASGMKAKPMLDAMRNVTGAVANPSIGVQAASAGGGTIQINFSPNIHFVGSMNDASKGQFLEVLRGFAPELLRMVEEAQNRRERRQFN